MVAVRLAENCMMQRKPFKGIIYFFIYLFISSPEPLGSQGELIV